MIFFKKQNYFLLKLKFIALTKKNKSKIISLKLKKALVLKDDPQINVYENEALLDLH